MQRVPVDLLSWIDFLGLNQPVIDESSAYGSGAKQKEDLPLPTCDPTRVNNDSQILVCV